VERKGDLFAGWVVNQGWGIARGEVKRLQQDTNGRNTLGSRGTAIKEKKGGGSPRLVGRFCGTGGGATGHTS